MIRPRVDTGKNSRWKELILLGSALTILTVILSFYFLTIYWMSDQPASSDFAKFYYSSRNFWEGEDIYQEVPLDFFGSRAELSGNSQDVLHPNLNPPFVILLLAPAGLFSYSSAYITWTVFSITLGLLAVRKIQTTLFPKLSPTGKIAWHIFLLAYFPTWISIIYGQFSLFLLFLLSSAWSELRSDRKAGAGIFLGLAISIKLFAGLFLFPLVIHRQWKVLAWALGTLATGIFSSFLILGPGPYLQYLKVLGDINWQSASWNASFHGFFMRIFGGSENAPLIPNPDVGQLLILVCSLGLLAGLFFEMQKGVHSSETIHTDKNFALGCAAMLLLSPLGWVYYFPVLWLSFAVGWVYSLPTKGKILLIMSWALSTLPHLLISAPDIQGWWVTLVLSGSYFYALVLLVTTLFIFCRPRTGTAV